MNAPTRPRRRRLLAHGAALAALLLHLTPDLDRAGFEVTQGEEMGRPSQLRASAWRIGRDVRAGVGGGAVPVLRGSVDL